jgi:hypothetical protein
MDRLRIILVAMTQLLGALSMITINANESTSGAAFRINPNGWLRKAIDALFFWQDSHCEKAVAGEIADCVELLNAYGFEIQPPPVPVAEAVKADHTSPEWQKRMAEQAPAREQEHTTDDPNSADFDAGAWFSGLPDEAKSRIVEWGVSIKMSRANRKRVAQIAQAWHNADAVARSGHGMTE